MPEGGEEGDYIPKIQTQKGSNKRLFILTGPHSMHIFGEIPFLCLDLVLER